MGYPQADHWTSHALVNGSDEGYRVLILSVGHMYLPEQDSSGICLGDDVAERILRHFWHVRGRSR